VIKNIDRVMAGVGIAVIVIFLVIALTPLPNYASGHFAIKPMIRPAGAIVVLGAGVLKGDMLDDASLRRTVYGIELYKANLAPLIVFSGPERGDVRTRTEAEMRLRIAGNMGVPEKAIIKEERALTTKEESIYISKVLQSQNIHSILLVTESMHMRRASYLFERAGMEVYSAPSDNFSIAATSSGDRLFLATKMAEETAALIYYRLAGYL
jgi:uncharacterized SAM-binding protein YcdF (DUF218 family)